MEPYSYLLSDSITLTVTENEKLPGMEPSEDSVSDLENSPRFVESEDLDSLPKRQFKTAEIADAVMGTEAPIDPSDIESLIPKNVKDYQSGFSPPSDENSSPCGSPARAASPPPLEEKSAESSQQVTEQKPEAWRTTLYFDAPYCVSK